MSIAKGACLVFFTLSSVHKEYTTLDPYDAITDPWIIMKCFLSD